MMHYLILICLMLSVSGQAHPVWGIVVDPQKNIYFPDLSHNERGSVWKLDNKGKLHLMFGDFHAHNVSLDEAGNLITAHGEEEHLMLRLKKNGEIDTLILSTDIQDFFWRQLHLF